MSRRPAPGRTEARAPDEAFDDHGRPSKTRMKQASHDLQSLGKDLAEMPESRLTATEMPESLRDAIHEFRRTRSHEGRRRQMQYIGKLMRGTDEAPLREAVAAWKLGGARDALRLHEAEAWRGLLIADDEALTKWAAEVPGTDLQRLRSLVRSARADAKPDPATGLAMRQGRAFRELFQFIRDGLTSGGDDAAEASATGSDDRDEQG